MTREVDTHRAILAAWRVEQPRLITGLARMLRDVPLAEELTQEALVAALERWPQTGVPERPGAWLMATAKRRALDHLRRRTMLARKHAMVAHELESEQQAMPDLDAPLDDDIGDDVAITLELGGFHFACLPFGSGVPVVAGAGTGFGATGAATPTAGGAFSHHRGP